MPHSGDRPLPGSVPKAQTETKMHCYLVPRDAPVGNITDALAECGIRWYEIDIAPDDVVRVTLRFDDVAAVVASLYKQGWNDYRLFFNTKGLD